MCTNLLVTVSLGLNIMWLCLVAGSSPFLPRKTNSSTMKSVELQLHMRQYALLTALVFSIQSRNEEIFSEYKRKYKRVTKRWGKKVERLLI